MQTLKPSNRCMACLSWKRGIFRARLLPVKQTFRGGKGSLTEVNMSINPSTQEISWRKIPPTPRSACSAGRQSGICCIFLIVCSFCAFSATVVCFSIIKTDCTSRRKLTLINKINQFVIENTGLIALVRPAAVCWVEYYALFSLHLEEQTQTNITEAFHSVT